MLTSTLFPLLTIASMARGLPLDSLGSPLTERATGEVVTGPLNANNGGGSLASPSSSTPAGQWEPSATATGGQGPSVKLADTSVTGGTGSSSYKLYTGDGKSWPSQDKWIGDFETMFNNNKPTIKVSCAQWSQPNPSDKEIQDMHDGILAASKASGVDKRFVLAIVMQESKGCPRVPTTNGGVVNPGLMQDHAGQNSCTTSPCSTDTIHGMILEGTAGTNAGDGLAECINTASNEGATGAQAFYWAARIYNTGSYTAGADLGKPAWGTSCYSSDVANRLTGWAGSDTSCTLPNPTGGQAPA